MPPIGLSYEEVAKACAQIQGQGEKITVRRLQTELGGRSSRLLLQHYQRWMTEQRPSTVGSGSSLDVSPALRSALFAEIETQVAAAKTDSEQRLAETQQLYEGASQALAAVEMQVEDLSTQLERERIEATKKIASLDQSLAALRAQMQEIEQQRTDGQQALTDARKVSADLERRAVSAEVNFAAAQQRISELEAEKAEGQQRLGEIHKNLEREQQEAKELRAQLERERTEAAATQERLKLVEHESQRVAAELETLRAASYDCTRQAVAAETRLSATQERLTEFRAAEGEWKKELAAMREELTQAHARINAEVERRATAEQRCALLNNRKTSEEATINTSPIAP